MSQKVVIIDTGCANVSSVKFAIERLGYDVSISKDPEVVLTADKLFLPGVGTASEAMKNLEQRNLIELVKKVEKPMLGICLGMQLMGKLSEEKGQKADEIVDCLGLVSGEVRLMQTGDLPLPHMGWNTVSANAGNPLFKGIEEGEYFYFVHSFAMPVGDYTIAQCEYGQPFSAAIQNGNYYGVQFHPERSSRAGSKLIQNFLEL
ncbi:imidazole glycerol phosphate synthase subunit HisH [Vibrio fluvialis]|nr:imidazole glycerol phosphate synthase subunit HisH [Vibrio fluvialis]ELI5721482.1 imidazole glycerol phosphate synthase subunit HisH [Vibrio fluvialis]ELI5721545.1 imidazole glycerol phosphate synthase subunit HisH [Vibrio fluvialis]MBY7849117.1 imidazole glycerol phosphate synthase subunit HisH [Vibrio fluvialis]MBY8127009.1 imidazole glycerol phosphate synthase subunit HisH [Vibrio fluvialis]